jgi:cytochrome P450
LRATRHFLRDPLDYFVDLRRYGEVVRTSVGPLVFHTFYDPRGLRHVFVDHPQRYSKRGVIDDLRPVLGEGLLSAEGAAWRERRAALAPGLSPQALVGLVPAMDEVAGRLLARWKRDDVVDASSEMGRLALGVVGQTLFGVPLEHDAERISAAVEQVARLALQRSQSLLKAPLSWPTPANRAYRGAIGVLRHLVDGIIREAGTKAPFMRRLHAATGGDVDALRHEVMTFLLAGHETTATTLAWSLALLSRDEELQERARDACRAVKGGGALMAQALDELPLIDAIVSETLRLYPPGWMLMRRAEEADTILGYDVPRGSFITAPVHALHRHPDLWERPERFQPSRFLEGRVPPDPLAYLPFGAGARRCVGEAFVRLETRVLLVRLLTRFRLQPVGELPAPLPLMTLRPREPVRLRLG